MNYLVKIEGQDIPVPEEIGGSDEAVRRALSTFYPEVAGALITRVTAGDTVTITVVKKAGTKGRRAGFDPLGRLVDCPGGQNPVIALYAELSGPAAQEEVEPEALLVLDDRIEAAIQDGEAQARRVAVALERLRAAVPQPAPARIAGF